MKEMRAAAVLACSAMLLSWQRADLAIRYVANAGMLVSVDGVSLLVDAPIRDGIPPYTVSPEDERRALESARPPYDGVSAILVTHWHEDHFDPNAVAAHLASNPRARLISSPEVVSRVVAVAPSLDRGRLDAVLPAPGASVERLVGTLRVHVLRIRHNPARRLPEQHVGFLIQGSTTVLHVGDADPKADNFAMMRGLPRVDVALLPFWYVLDDANRQFVAAAIAPRRVVAMHMPGAEAGALRRALAGAALDVRVPFDPGPIPLN